MTSAWRSPIRIHRRHRPVNQIAFICPLLPYFPYIFFALAETMVGPLTRQRNKSSLRASLRFPERSR